MQTDVKLGLRFVNLIVDWLAIYLVSIAIGYIITALGLVELSKLIIAHPYISGAIIYFGYYFSFETFTNRTLGKFITRTKVVTIDGSVPNSKDIAGRTLARLIPFEPFSFFGSLGNGWHDRLSGTKVIPAL